MGFKIKKTVNGETVWKPIKAKKYTTSKITEYTGALPITINANGEVLIDYRIYGASGWVGERTENLFDNRTRGFYNSANGVYIYDPNYSYWRIPVTEGDIIYADNIDTMGWGCCFYQGNYVKGSRLRSYNFPYTVPAGVDEVTNNYPAGSSAMVTVNRAIPTSYVPHGYKLPMTVGDGNTAQTVPVYIGENQLEENEYVSFSEQKIYRDVSGTLTPTDPPVPLPEIPTIKGETVIDYDGEPKPSQMYIKYNSWSGWSDIDNYKMANGNWTQEVT